jgi:hypothetical protein
MLPNPSVEDIEGAAAEKGRGYTNSYFRYVNRNIR